MSTFADIKTSLNKKGFVATSVSINTKLNALIIRSAYALYLYSRLRSLGSEVSFNKSDDSVLVYDEPLTFFKHLEAL